MKLLDSRALEFVNRVLGISGGAGTRVEVDDGVLQQVFDVGPLIRRGRSPASGILSTGILNTHSGAAASTASGTIDPYGANALAVGLWPKPIPPELDVWVLAVTAQVATHAAANFDGGRLNVTFPAGRGLNVGLPVTQVIATSVVQPTTEQSSLTIMEYNSESDLGTDLGFTLSPVASGATSSPIPLRLPRDCLLQWTTRTNALGASVYRVEITLGLFASGLGQDGAF